MSSYIQLSVIVPIYNAEQTIDYCLESLYDSNLEGQYEIICVNDGSKDNTLKRLEEWKSRYPDIIRIINKPNGGVSSSCNIGIKESRGEWLFFCDSDDFIAKNSLSSILTFISNYPQDIGLVQFKMKHTATVTDDVFEGINGVSFYGSSKVFFLNHLFWTSWMFLFRRALIIQEGIEFLDVNGCEDQLFNVTFLLKTEMQVLLIDADVYRYVTNPLSFCHTFNNGVSKRYVYDALRVLNEYNRMTPPKITAPDMHNRMRWVSAKMMPNIFARMRHANMTLQEFREVKRKLVSLQCVPNNFKFGWQYKIKEFFILHPLLFYLGNKLSIIIDS